MRYGVCIRLDENNVKYASEYGYDYVEVAFGMFTKEESERYEIFKENLKKYNIKCEAANNFFPEAIKTTGDEVDFDKIREYVEYGMNKAHQIGVKTVVFGSGGSRQVPDGFCFGKAFNQLVDICKNIISPIAQKYEITVVIEPLGNCNIINTVKEGAMLASFVGSDNFKSLSDIYHMLTISDKVENIRDCMGIIAHSHISRPDRGFPTDTNEYDYKGYIEILENINCERCSIEGKTADFKKDAELGIKLLRSL